MERGWRCSPHPGRAAVKGGQNDPGGCLSGLGNPRWREQRPPLRDPSLSASPSCDLAKGWPTSSRVFPPLFGLTWLSRGTSPASGHVWGHSMSQGAPRKPAHTPEGRTAILQRAFVKAGPLLQMHSWKWHNIPALPFIFLGAPTPHTHRWRQISSPRILI